MMNPGSPLPMAGCPGFFAFTGNYTHFHINTMELLIDFTFFHGELMSTCANMCYGEFFVDAEHASFVIQELRTCKYDAELDGDANIIGVDYPGGNLPDGEEAMFGRNAPYVKSGSYIEMENGSGSRWRWVFKNGAVREVTARIVWPDEDQAPRTENGFQNHRSDVQYPDNDPKSI